MLLYHSYCRLLRLKRDLQAFEDDNSSIFPFYCKAVNPIVQVHLLLMLLLLLSTVEHAPAGSGI